MVFAWKFRVELGDQGNMKSSARRRAVALSQIASTRYRAFFIDVVH